MAHDSQPSREREPDQGADEQPEPTHSETRPRFSTPAPDDKRRLSGRPSAFGPPRPSRPPVSSDPRSLPPSALGPDSSPPTDPGRLSRELALHGSTASASASLPPPSSAPPPAPQFRADVEELLPLPDASQSLPRIPIAAVLPPPEPHAPHGRGLTRVAAFVLVVVASAVPVLRYTGAIGAASVESTEDTENTPTSSAAPSAQSAAPAKAVELPIIVPPARAPAPAPRDPVGEALARIESTLPADAHEAAEALVDEATHALEGGEVDLAEALLGRALKLDEHNPHAAFALAKLRLVQGNLEGAEGWALVALEHRPKRAEYHAFYAEILERLERGHEAHREREKARSLARH